MYVSGRAGLASSCGCWTRAATATRLHGRAWGSISGSRAYQGSTWGVRTSALGQQRFCGIDGVDDVLASGSATSSSRAPGRPQTCPCTVVVGSGRAQAGRQWRAQAMCAERRSLGRHWVCCPVARLWRTARGHPVRKTDHAVHLVRGHGLRRRSTRRCGLVRACTEGELGEDCPAKRSVWRRKCFCAAEAVARGLGSPTDANSRWCANGEGGDGCGGQDLVGGGRGGSQRQIRTDRDRRSDGMDACVVSRHGMR